MKKKIYKNRAAYFRAAKKRANRKIRSALLKAIRKGHYFSKQKSEEYSLETSKINRIKNRPLYRNGKELQHELWEKINPLITINVPKIFCFIKDPQGTAAFLEKLYDILFNNGCRNIFVSHENVESIGIGASYVFDELVSRAQDVSQEQGKRFYVRGLTSTKKSVNNFLLAFGLLNKLGISSNKLDLNSFDYDYSQKYYSFSSEGNKSKPYTKGQASTYLVNYFQKCFGHKSLSIVEKAQANLIEAFGEIIANAEEHGLNENDNWHVRGFFNKEDLNCRFAIVNRGISIYESLSNENSTAKETLEDISNFVNKQKTVSEKIKGVWAHENSEPLWNVMALQEGISSKRESVGGDTTRGRGLMDVIQFIDDIRDKKEDTFLTIISGHSAILIDFKYKIIKKYIEKTKGYVRMMVFNENGEISETQDISKVMYLKDKFAGTIITGSFKVSSSVLESSDA